MIPKQIAILLATYNSGEYLREQIDSLFNQTHKDWILYVRDDCSTDNTLEIIDEYREQYPNKVYIIDNQKESKRAYLNFVELLKNVDSDYYMFCDHDDVWLPNKIEVSIERMKSLEASYPDKPILVHTDMKVVDQNLNVISDSFWSYTKLLPEQSGFVELVCCNSVNGCTILFNKKAKTFALQHVEHATMHDMLLAQTVAASGGIVSAVNLPTVLYRQHIDNVVGAHERTRQYYMKKLHDLRFMYEDNRNWYRMSSNIKSYSVLYYLYIKVKINILKILKYKLSIKL